MEARSQAALVWLIITLVLLVVGIAILLRVLLSPPWIPS